MNKAERIFLTADTSFNNELEFRKRNRPFDSPEEMNESLISKWNEEVGANDIVYHLGNFGERSIPRLKSILFQLNGQISIIRSRSERSLKDLFEIGFSLVADKMELEYMGYLCIFTHLPLLMADDSGVINFHGEELVRPVIKDFHINVSIDAWDFKPVELKSLIRKHIKHKAGVAWNTK